MKKQTRRITTLFLDIGGVLLTNGWDHNSRKKAAEHFGIDSEELNERHHLTFDTYESGKISLDQYLDRIIFYEKRSFTRKDFKVFMFHESKRIDDSIDYFKDIKQEYGFKVVALSNEARELNEYRIKKYKLHELFDAFISSCYVHLRKPDTDIYKLACDVSNTPPENVLCIDDRLMFVQVALSLGIKAYHYRGLVPAKKYLKTVLSKK